MVPEEAPNYHHNYLLLGDIYSVAGFVAPNVAPKHSGCTRILAAIPLAGSAFECRFN